MTNLTPEQRIWMHGMANAGTFAVTEVTAAMKRITGMALDTQSAIDSALPLLEPVPPHVIEAMAAAELAARHTPKGDQ